MRDLSKIKEPQSTLEKTKLAKKLYEEYKSIRDTKEMVSWYQAKLIYFLDKFKLHNYLFGKSMSRSAFYGEIDIPLSTANFLNSLYAFYIVKQGFTFDEVKDAALRKLHRALPYLHEKNKEEIKEAVELAKRETLSLSDYLISLGRPENYCVHEPEFIVEKRQKICSKCGKKIGNN